MIELDSLVIATAVFLFIMMCTSNNKGIVRFLGAPV
jgi:hypothetical protein